MEQFDAGSVVVVSDDEWRRRGLADGVREMGGVTKLVDAIASAHACQVDWSSVAVALIVDGGPTRDRHASMDVAAHVDSATTAILLGDRRALHDVALLRAHEVGVDFFYEWDDVTSVRDLERVLLAPRDERAPWDLLDPEVLRNHGLTRSSRPDAGLRYLAARTDLASAGGKPPLTRRQTITLRRKLSSVIGMGPGTAFTATSIDRRLPSWREIDEVLAAARGCATSAPFNATAGAGEARQEEIS